MTSPDGGPMIVASGICKTFGTTRALAGVNLEAARGQVLALLGPNGAGKTTLVRILTTLQVPDDGWARVAGFDVVREASKVRSVIGLTGQFAAIDLLLTGRENLEMVGELCGLSRRTARHRAEEMLARFGLEAAASRQAGTYSGGMRRRLDLAASIIADPPVLVLDEPTTGLDPRTRGDVWAAVERLVSDGTTVLLTTQYLEEADRLAHRIVVIDQGLVVAEGTSDELKTRLGGDVVEVRLARPADLDPSLAALGALREGGSANRDSQRITLPAPDGVTTLRSAMDRLATAHVHVDDISLRRPSLDDVFLALTGHDTGQNAEPAGTPAAGSRGPAGKEQS
jgi:ABC-2 type transport system ATP-binding protein